MCTLKASFFELSITIVNIGRMSLNNNKFDALVFFTCSFQYLLINMANVLLLFHMIPHSLNNSENSDDDENSVTEEKKKKESNVSAT